MSLRGEMTQLFADVPPNSLCVMLELVDFTAPFRSRDI